MKYTFGQDSDVTCLGLAISEGADLEFVIFEALQEVSKTRRRWHETLFSASNDNSFYILVFARTRNIKNSIRMFSQIPNNLLELRKQQAGDANFVYYTTPTNTECHAMIYYY